MDKNISDFHKPDMYHNIGLCTQTIYDGLKMKSAGFIVERVAATNHLRNVHSGMFQIEFSTLRKSGTTKNLKVCQ